MPVTVFGSSSTATVVDGTSFCVSALTGDIASPPEGFFVAGSCFLSHYLVELDGQPLRLLSCGSDRHFSADFHLRPHSTLRDDGLSVRRRRTVAGQSFEDVFSVHNHSERPKRVELAFAVDADFRASGKSGEGEVPVRSEGLWQLAADGRELTLADTDARFGYKTALRFSEPIVHKKGRFACSLLVPAGGEAHLVVLASADTADTPAAPDGFPQACERAERERLEWLEAAPALTAPGLPALSRAYERSVADLAALRIRDPRCPEPMIAAGLPWFLTVFGRDSLITCLQTMLFGDGLAKSTLRVLAALQATEDDSEIEAEPGKILHELRSGKKADSWFERYYGTVDATPLWLVLLSEVYRWTGDDAFAAEMREPALRALEWCDRYGDSDGDGYVEFEKRRQGERGLSVHTWKDSQPSQVFRDGTLAEAPIAAAEVQGYVYDAKRRLAELARESWGDLELASRLEVEAADLYQRFNRDFWLEEGYYALALDAAKRPVDGLASNMGHLLWSGIVPGARVSAVAGHLLGSELFSGWGIRTLGAQQGSYNPLTYHNGCVWPHDTSLAAWGLARNWHRSELEELALALLEAADLFGGQLPELFAGHSRAESPFPVTYPATCKPQAWAAGVPVLLLRLLLQLEPSRVERALVARGSAPAFLDGLKLEGVRCFNKRFSVSVVGDETRVVEL